MRLIKAEMPSKKAASITADAGKSVEDKDKKDGSKKEEKKGLMQKVQEFTSAGDKIKSPLQLIAGALGALVVIFVIFHLPDLFSGEFSTSTIFVTCIIGIILFGTYIGGEPYALLFLLVAIFAVVGYSILTGQDISTIFNGGYQQLGSKEARETHKMSKKDLEDTQILAEATLLKGQANLVVYRFKKSYDGAEVGQEALLIDKKSEKEAFVWVRLGDDGVYDGKEILAPMARLEVVDRSEETVSYGTEKLIEKSKETSQSKSSAPRVIYSKTFTEEAGDDYDRVTVLNYSKTKIIPGDEIRIHSIVPAGAPGIMIQQGMDWVPITNNDYYKIGYLYQNDIPSSGSQGVWIRRGYGMKAHVEVIRNS